MCFSGAFGNRFEMADFALMRELAISNSTKLVLLVMDGLGGLPIEPDGPTELEAAQTPNLDQLASGGALGRLVPVSPGVAPGSGPAHLALFGYDPLRYNIGRGVLEAFGIGVPVTEGDVAARGNFCTVDAQGRIVDRRAGRIPTEQATQLVAKLQGIELPGAEAEVRPVREYRFLLVLRGQGLSPDVEETDPLQVGLPPLPARAATPAAARTADLFNQWIAEAQRRLEGEHPANSLTLRGFSTDPHLPKYEDVYKLRAACVAVYPMYRGVSSLVGMRVLEFQGETTADQFAEVARRWKDFEFFFVHVKPTDSRGEDGDFAGKAKVIEAVDAALPALLALKPDVLVVTGDHSTPARLRTHSWHPVPLLLWAPATVLPDGSANFGERACARGALGTFPSADLMPLMLAHAGRLSKYGA